MYVLLYLAKLKKSQRCGKLAQKVRELNKVYLLGQPVGILHFSPVRSCRAIPAIYTDAHPRNFLDFGGKRGNYRKGEAKCVKWFFFAV